MKYKWKLIAVLILAPTLAIVALAIGAVVAYQAVVDRFFTVHATPETESAFLKQYKPELVVDEFRLKSSFGWQNSMSAGSGRESAIHSGDYQSDVAIDPGNWTSLMSAMNDDLSAQLSRSGAQILDQSGDVRDGYRFDYKLGKTFGSVVISPLKIVKVQQNPNCAIVHVNILIEEKYFRKEPGIISVRIKTNRSQ
jgi:hypothetical protein